MSNQINQEDLHNKLLHDFHGNEVIINKEITTIPTIEKNCLKYFKEILPEKGDFIRIMIQGGGCSGFQYAFFFNDPPLQETDITINDIPKVVIDAESILYMKGAIIKLEKTPFTQRIYVDNPGAKSSCGCGTSFNYEL